MHLIPINTIVFKNSRAGWGGGCTVAKSPGSWEPESISQRGQRASHIGQRGSQSGQRGSQSDQKVSGRCEMLSGCCEMLSGSQVPGLFATVGVEINLFNYSLNKIFSHKIIK